MIDTHAHLHFPQFDEDREEIIRECENKLDAVITVGGDLEDSKKAVELAMSSRKIYASVGIHPHEAKNYSEKDYDRIVEISKSSPKVVALGEMGLDFYRNLSSKEKQYEIFEMQIEAARELNLPVIIHSRNAGKETASFIRTKFKGIKGVLHCFSGDKELLKAALDEGLYISYAGIVTYPKNSELRETLKYVPSSRLLIETDSPYLAPQPVRGKRNKPAYVAYVAMTIAKELGLSFLDIDRMTSLNAKRLFGLSLTEEEKKERLAYTVGNKLYVNLTSKCPCSCKFCFRGKEDFILGYNLNLRREPIPEEYMYRIKNPGIYDEIVFCGYGEPFERFDVLKKVAEWIRKMGGKHLRVDTCGLGYLITGRENILDELKGLIDTFNVSVNASAPEEYYEIVRPKFGSGSWESLLKFIKDAKRKGFKVIISAVNYPGFNEKAFIDLANRLQVDFKIRNFKRFGKWEE
ncbi:hydrolase, TatD family [Desulfurobacterium thermolithotrophum DSM 11699]|uniref:Hydrolase, TatD family n=1 Tax=Desulfurobacterium thermolithotrophum (strain DSM 11699 / BSA) TaxID=868864 RepID=F0S050_DESTD|nr:YchF/TatD family DNA exonuclease [Desulfurobacterium thermolithotrophum]ADY73731.1 hydrolase, TatD family [Desulfurobacterium thermolithotrophum DSM 11699]